VYVLKNEKLRIEIIWLHYNVLVTEHGERWKMTELVTKNYWWPEVIRDVKKYVDSYNLCQRMKNQTKALVEKLMANEVPEKL